MANCVATILGNPDFPSIREVNVRAAPGITNPLLFTTPLQVKATVLGCENDPDKSARDGKVYCWLKLAFPDGRVGWVRDDLIEIEGDGSAFGYGFIPQRLQAFKLTRTIVVVMPEPTPTPEPTPQPEPTPEEQVTPARAPTAITQARDGVNVRRGPSTAQPAITRFAYRTRADILDAKPEANNGSRFKWVQLAANGAIGWVREDYLRYEGDVSQFGLAAPDAYPAPVQNSHWVRDFNTDPNFAGLHYGWDLGGAVGEPVLAGPNGGYVAMVAHCSNCTPQRPSVIDHGISLNDPGMLNNPAWGYGFGHYVVVRYLFEQLPASCKAELTRRNLPNYHIFAIYAHLSAINVTQGQTLPPNQRIGALGNSGNSSGPHLHLELRAWNNPNETSYGRMISNRLDPVVLFRR